LAIFGRFLLHAINSLTR